MHPATTQSLCSSSHHARPPHATHRGKEAEWFLEVESGDIDQRADSSLNYVADVGQQRITFAANGALWALRFPSAASYRAFMTELEVRVWSVVGGWGWGMGHSAGPRQQA
jgi:hypothetical protein